jgi:uncharacterized protein YqeY
MMKDQIIKDFQQSRKDRNADATLFLSTLYGAIQTKEKQGVVMNDAEVIRVVKSFIESVEVTEQHAGPSEKTQMERNILNRYLPKQLTVAEIHAILSSVAPANKGAAQQFMKTNYAGQYNGADVNTAFGLL